MTTKEMLDQMIYKLGKERLAEMMAETTPAEVKAPRKKRVMKAKPKKAAAVVQVSKRGSNIPVSFAAASKKMTVLNLAGRYKKSVGTIYKWKRKLPQPAFKTAAEAVAHQVAQVS